MITAVTKAIIVARTPVRERDATITLYTPIFGIIEARAEGARAPKAKLGPHLDPVRRSLVRIVRKNGFVIADALTENAWGSVKADAPRLRDALAACAIICAIAPREEGDEKTWHEINRQFENGTASARTILRQFGYGAADVCIRCGRSASRWYVPDHAPLCTECSAHIPERDIVIL